MNARWLESTGSKLSRESARHRLEEEAVKVRSVLEPAFSSETASGLGGGRTPSSGQCAAVAVVLHQALGGSLVSAVAEGVSHWFNRLRVGGHEFDLDLTGDQFGLEAVRIARPGRLYDGTRVRSLEDVQTETLRRANLLAKRSGLLTDTDDEESA